MDGTRDPAIMLRDLRKSYRQVIALDVLLASVIWSCTLLAGFSLLAVGHCQRISR